MTLEDLGRRAVACKHWRWMEGMLAGTTRIVDVKDGPYVFDSEYEDCAGLPHKAVPDLSDPATLGCLLALVREAWANDNMHARPEGDRWRVWSDEPGAFVFGSEAEALVAALEAAP